MTTIQSTAQSSARDTGSTQTTDPAAEIRSTRETAEKIAKEGATEGTDIARLLGGLIAHLAEQVEKIATGPSVAPPPSGGPTEGSSDDQSADAAREEDVSPEDAPAAPVRDPNAEQG